MTQDSLGDRMKGYENIQRIKLEPNQPVIVRIDGKAFHTYTRGFQFPFDPSLRYTFHTVCEFLMKNVQGCKMIYCQSDEISLILSDLDSLSTAAWFDYNVQKIASVSASMTTAIFNNTIGRVLATNMDESEATILSNRIAFFDARVFAMPKEDIPNYIIWRQQDWIRNSVSMLARSKFSDKQLFKKNTDEVRKMLIDINEPWEDLPDIHKWGSLYHIEKDDSGDITGTHWVHSKLDYAQLARMFEKTHGHSEYIGGELDPSMYYDVKIYVDAPNRLITFTAYNLKHGGYSRGPEDVVNLEIAATKSIVDSINDMKKNIWFNDSVRKRAVTIFEQAIAAL